MRSNEDTLRLLSDMFNDCDFSGGNALALLVTDIIETGIGYWCDIWPDLKDVDGQFYCDKVWNALKRGDTLKFGCAEASGTISACKMLDTLEWMKANDPELYENITTGNWDACDCDSFFQYVIFGEIVFG